MWIKGKVDEVCRLRWVFAALEAHSSAEGVVQDAGHLVACIAQLSERAAADEMARVGAAGTSEGQRGQARERMR